MPTCVELISMTKLAPLSVNVLNGASKRVALGVNFSVPTTSTPLSIGILPPVALLGLARQPSRNLTSGIAKAASSWRMPN